MVVVRLNNGNQPVELIKQNKRTVLVRIQNTKTVKDAEGKDQLVVTYKTVKRKLRDVISA